jgi:tetratricopeptide (TPR) repeat protein
MSDHEAVADDGQGRAVAAERGKARSLARDQSAKDIAICLVVALAETSLVLTSLAGAVSLPTMLLIHCGIMLGVTLVLDQRERHRQDSRVLAVAVVTTAVSGPIGAALSALLGIYLRYRKLETELLANWYERISGHKDQDAVLELHERIQAGRTLNPFVDARARFAAILRSGPLEEKQRVLSVITQKYHPGFAGLLQLALRNQDPPIRVQAAAVAARLKENERVKIRALMAELEAVSGQAFEQKLDLAGKVGASLDSALLDDQDAAAGRMLAEAACRDVIEHDPPNSLAYLQLAHLLMGQKNYSEAADLLRPLAGQSIEESYEPLRDCLVHLRYFSEAATLAQKASDRMSSDNSTTPIVVLGGAA